MSDFIKEKIEDGIMIVIFIVILIAVFSVINFGIKKKEINECNNWAEMSKKYKDFYLTKAEAEQCNFLNIKINAPIK